MGRILVGFGFQARELDLDLELGRDGGKRLAKDGDGSMMDRAAIFVPPRGWRAESPVSGEATKAIANSTSLISLLQYPSGLCLQVTATSRVS